ncbi:unnamed protein product, partial [Ectocarpus fasciculatus]
KGWWNRAAQSDGVGGGVRSSNRSVRLSCEASPPFHVRPRHTCERAPAVLSLRHDVLALWLVDRCLAYNGTTPGLRDPWLTTLMRPAPSDHKTRQALGRRG